MSYIHKLVQRLSEAPAQHPGDRAIPRASEGSLLIRMAREADAAKLSDLAELDGARPVCGPSLIALVEGELWAAISLTDGRVIADPFRATAPAVALLRVRAAQLRGQATSEGRAPIARRAWRRARA